MKVHAYKGGYDEYLEVQKATTKRKRRRQWVTEGDVAFLARIMVRRNWQRATGLCHGTRSGREQRWFAKYLSAEVIGSELNPIKEDALTVQHDFNSERADWVGRFSFVYSNSFDHAYDPERTMKVWADQLCEGGRLIIEHTRMHVHTSATDPTGGTPEEYAKLIARAGLTLDDTLVYRSPDNPIVKRYFIITP